MCHSHIAGVTKHNNNTTSNTSSNESVKSVTKFYKKEENNSDICHSLKHEQHFQPQLPHYYLRSREHEQYRRSTLNNESALITTHNTAAEHNPHRTNSASSQLRCNNNNNNDYDNVLLYNTCSARGAESPSEYLMGRPTNLIFNKPMLKDLYSNEKLHSKYNTHNVVLEKSRESQLSVNSVLYKADMKGGGIITNTNTVNNNNNNNNSSINDDEDEEEILIARPDFAHSLSASNEPATTLTSPRLPLFVDNDDTSNVCVMHKRVKMSSSSSSSSLPSSSLLHNTVHNVCNFTILPLMEEGDGNCKDLSNSQTLVYEDKCELEYECEKWEKEEEEEEEPNNHKNKCNSEQVINTSLVATADSRDNYSSVSNIVDFTEDVSSTDKCMKDQEQQRRLSSKYNEPPYIEDAPRKPYYSHNVSEENNMTYSAIPSSSVVQKRNLKEVCTNEIYNESNNKLFVAHESNTLVDLPCESYKCYNNMNTITITTTTTTTNNEKQDYDEIVSSMHNMEQFCNFAESKEHVLQHDANIEHHNEYLECGANVKVNPYFHNNNFVELCASRTRSSLTEIQTVNNCASEHNVDDTYHSSTVANHMMQQANSKAEEEQAKNAEESLVVGCDEANTNTNILLTNRLMSSASFEMTTEFVHLQVEPSPTEKRLAFDDCLQSGSMKNLEEHTNHDNDNDNDYNNVSMEEEEERECKALSYLSCINDCDHVESDKTDKDRHNAKLIAVLPTTEQTQEKRSSCFSVIDVNQPVSARERKQNGLKKGIKSYKDEVQRPFCKSGLQLLYSRKRYLNSDDNYDDNNNNTDNHTTCNDVLEHYDSSLVNYNSIVDKENDVCHHRRLVHSVSRKRVCHEYNLLSRNSNVPQPHTMTVKTPSRAATSKTQEKIQC